MIFVSGAAPPGRDEDEGTGDLANGWVTTVPSVVESGEAFSLKEVLLEYGQEDPADAGECEGAGWGSPGL